MNYKVAKSKQNNSITPASYDMKYPHSIYFQKNNLTFGVIEPKHLFINKSGFDKNYDWANSVIEGINSGTAAIEEGKDCQGVLDEIIKGYRGFYTNPENAKKFDNYVTIPSYYGKQRTEDMKTLLKKEDERYGDYLYKIREDKMDQTAEVNGIKAYESKAEILINGEPVTLTKTFKSVGYNSSFYTLSGRWQHTPPENIPKVMKHLGEIYSDVREMKPQIKQDTSNTDVLNEINNKMAKMHWLMVQAMPYCRGSAGIADAFTKSMYEYLGIQVSPWKQGIAPDLEALVTPLDEYTKNYTGLFEHPPTVKQ